MLMQSLQHGPGRGTWNLVYKDTFKENLVLKECGKYSSNQSCFWMIVMIKINLNANTSAKVLNVISYM